MPVNIVAIAIIKTVRMSFKEFDLGVTLGYYRLRRDAILKYYRAIALGLGFNLGMFGATSLI